MNNIKDYIIGGIIGLIVGDAVGVPAEFKSREYLRKKPVTDMTGYGTHYQPAGTWSDDSSMTLCTMDSLCSGYNPTDMMEKFCAWFYNDEYTPHGQVFDSGIATRNALSRYRDGSDLMSCGGRDEYSNGNGSLMRILPMVFYQYVHYSGFMHNIRPVIIDPIHEVSALTHAHPISMIGCGIYAQLIAAMLNDKSERESKKVDAGLIDKLATDSAWNDYGYNGYGNLYHDADYKDALDCYSRLRDIEAFQNLPEEQIKSSGYIVYTLEAALWCFLNTDNYRDCVLKAVNLGGDTDTVAAVAGSFAGILYGYDSIPEEWLKNTARLDWILELCDKFAEAILK